MSANVPPVIPGQLPPVIKPATTVILPSDAANISGAAGLTREQLRDAVAQGGRFVMFQYCISVLVLSFKRSSAIYFVKPGESAFGKGLPYSLISLLLGWWGIPWGPIWTFICLATNLSGGKDVTQPLLTAFGLSMPPPAAPTAVSPVEAAEREARKSRILWAAWAAVLVLLLGVAWLGLKIYEAGRHSTPTPGEAEFRQANDTIGSGGTGDSGNTPAAAKLARQMSMLMQVVRTVEFDQSKRKSIMDENDRFKTYCLLRPDECVFLVHVPELRRFTSHAQDSLGKSAWASTQSLLQESKVGKADMRLAVGLRGIAAYNRVLTGHYLAGANETNSGLADVHEGLTCERELFPWFAEDPQVSSVPASAPGEAKPQPAAP